MDGARRLYCGLRCFLAICDGPPMRIECTRLARGALARIALLASALIASTAQAGGGILGIDHLVGYDNAGIWKRSYQQWLIGSLLVSEAGIGLWEGGESRFGRTVWQSIDSTVAGTVAATVLKYAFRRERPSHDGNPDEWFRSSSAQSFPSGEVTVTSAIVTPLVLEYRHDDPAVFALEAIPVYDAIARVKVHGHWQSDVIAGFALGTAAGYLVHARAGSPLILSVMPHGVYVGLKKSL